MNRNSFKVIERSDSDRVTQVAEWLTERGYKPVGEITQMPDTGLYTQVMQWEPSMATLRQQEVA